jgi:hypothetical protein
LLGASRQERPIRMFYPWLLFLVPCGLVVSLSAILSFKEEANFLDKVKRVCPNWSERWSGDENDDWQSRKFIIGVVLIFLSVMLSTWR